MKYGLIGSKLDHSFSKAIHEKLGDYEYELHALTEDEFKKFMKEKAFLAINVTIPYKEKVIPYLNIVSKHAQLIKAVNTVINKEGKLYGCNTDYFGLKALIEKLNLNLRDKKVLILGTGGTSKTAQVVISELGCTNFYLVSRTKKSEERIISYEEVKALHADVDVIINTTPLGMFPNNNEVPLDITGFDRLVAIVDVIYNPLRTKLLSQAKKRGISYIGGLYMLVAQAYYASCLFQDKLLDLELIDQIYHDLLLEKENIVLTGMPSCGKSTIGKILASRLHKDFVDTDILIQEQIGMSIKDYIKMYGEEAFREVEKVVVREISKKNNQVIATGGGVILCDENIENLNQNGKIVFLNRKLDNLIPTDDRPLTSSKKMLEEVYQKRLPVYQTTCEFMVDNNQEIEKVTDEIVKKVTQ